MIHEDEEQEDKLFVIKPFSGVDSTRMQPIVRKLDLGDIAITPL